MMKLLIAWIRWKLAESNARNQRRFSAECEERWHSARRGIPLCDQHASNRGAEYRNIRLARRFPLLSEKDMLRGALERRL
jgi:hypothetical protein